MGKRRVSDSKASAAAKAMRARVNPANLAKATKAAWAKRSPEERKAHAQAMARARWGERKPADAAPVTASAAGEACPESWHSDPRRHSGRCPVCGLAWTWPEADPPEALTSPPGKTQHDSDIAGNQEDERSKADHSPTAQTPPDPAPDLGLDLPDEWPDDEGI